jgi:two-component system, NtrC family, sensor kinase
MDENLQSIQEFINKIGAVNDAEKKDISGFLKKAEKTIEVNNFKFTRVEKELKTLSILLEETIGELQKKSTVVEQANKELTKTLKDLKDAQQQLVMAEKMASLGQLTAGVAHEINNPINFVSANIKPLKEDLADILECIGRYEKVIKENKLENLFAEVERFKNNTDIAFSMQEVNDLLRGIEEGASRTTEIVKGLRNFSRLDQNVIKKASINEGIESTLSLLHSAYKDRVEVEKDLGDIPEVECFPGQVNQVLMNILSNAIQAISGKGKIFIKTWNDSPMVKISITDTGSGMSEETKQKIFDPFFTTKEVGKGTGLGLSISYGIIEKHKGKIEVNSEIGKGTTFIISLPVIHENEKIT